MNLPLKLNEKCVFYPYEGSGGPEEFLLYAPGGRQFVVSSLAKDILQSLNGRTSLDQIAHRLQANNIPISAAQLQGLLEERYRPMGIFEGYMGPDLTASPASRIRKNPIPILLQWGLLPARFVLHIAKPLTVLFHRFAVLAVVMASAASHYWLYGRQLPGLADDAPDVNVLAVTALVLLGILVHEFGHASAVTRYGGSPGAIGFGLYALMPSFYTDVSEVWRFPRRQRMVVDCAGVYFQQFIYPVFVVLGNVTTMPAFTMSCLVLDTMVLLNLNPVFQFDGYWFLVDYLGLPDLNRLAWKHLKKWIFRSRNTTPLPPLSRQAYLVFVAYAAGSAGFVALLLRMEYRLLFIPVTGFVAGLPKMLSVLIGDFREREFLKLTRHLLSVLYFIVVPVSVLLGLSTYVIRIYRYLSQRMKTKTLANICI